MKKIFPLILALSFVVSIYISTSVAQDIEVRPVHFAKGTSSAAMSGHVRGDKIVDYQLQAKAGQRMHVKLETNNTSNHFNVLPSGSETALFIGSTKGNEWSGILPKNGNYRIRVYLMRSAARRNETAQYTLRVKISDVAKSGRDAKVPGTSFHATGKVNCVMASGQANRSCDFGVRRMGQGSGVVTITKPNGSKRTIYFRDGKATGISKGREDKVKFSSKKMGDDYIIRIGDEMYKIPEAVLTGG